MNDGNYRPAVRVLVFPAGEENAVEVGLSLSSQVNIEVFGASSVDRAGPFIFQKYFGGLPDISDPAFVSEFNELLAKWEIDFVIPTHDDVVVYLASNKDLVTSQVLGPLEASAKLMRSKRRTLEFFSSYEWCQKELGPDEIRRIDKFFVRPDKGSGGKGARTVFSSDRYTPSSEEVATEFLSGPEYTVDCFSNTDSELMIALPRRRREIRGGISVSSEEVNSESLNQFDPIASTISKDLTLIGAWHFQVKEDADGRLKLLEVAARPAGGQVFSRARGLNLPLLHVYQAMGLPISMPKLRSIPSNFRTLISISPVIEDIEIAYVDLDDTLISAGQVNLDAISLIYQLRNNGSKVVLVTRHAGNLRRTLKRAAISENLFSSVHHLRNGEAKSGLVDDRFRCVFIDNSFREREEVSANTKAQVFDVESIRFLRDWRV